MSIRERLDKELESVQQAFLTLCDKSIHQFELSFQAFIEKDMELAKRIIEEDVEMNKMEEEIHNKVVLLLTKQQPIVATDLRRLIVLLKAASDMERVGDYAVNISKEAIRIGEKQFITSVELMEDMCYKTISMLRQVVNAFVEENVQNAKEIAEMDDQIDEMYGNMIAHLMKLSAISPESVSQITYLSFVCRFIERCADLATNMAEYILYLKKGLYLDLNR
ncbi:MULTISPECIES: phosphate signaling complex protein PhoU [Ureibacillus]|uniref:Phosphate-specific transport system accessory protein PhoU n=1 Tax=Ureibacillus thermosphaericus TaxID=51173 RepID=A0A840Q186_URETH|nr:phosphate signaling complex protein PhoU [Ureibacillus thermosphaericus]MBB5148826.1 phosphate transport system protein [Ureibacillus thermosphaericus]NKZ31603.1 phosphate signaling complex protein PhoU [Ureibacillus thermosphaericus]